MTLSLYIVVAIYSTVYSYRRLHRPGVSGPVRSRFVKKHFLYVLIFIVIWMIQQSNNYYFLFNPSVQDFDNNSSNESYAGMRRSTSYLHRLGEELGFRKKQYQDMYGASSSDPSSSTDTNFVTQLSGFMTFSTGIFLTAVRLYEPLFRVIILQTIYQYFG